MPVDWSGCGVVTGYVAWTCNGCRDVHYMREPMYVGGLCRRCADRADMRDMQKAWESMVRVGGSPSTGGTVA